MPLARICQTDLDVAGGRLDDGLAEPKPPVVFGVLDDAQRESFLRRTQAGKSITHRVEKA